MTSATSPLRIILCSLLFALILIPGAGCGDGTQSEHTDVTTTTNSAPPLTGNFFTLSDVHFDPFYDPTLTAQLMKTGVQGWEAIFKSSKVQNYGVYGEDSNYPLMVNAFAEMKNVTDNPDFIIITGDFLGHDFQSDFSQYANISSTSPAFKPAVDSFITKTIQFIALELQKQFPSTPFYPVLGNNDDYCGDYMIQPKDPFLTMFAKTWAPFMDSANRVSFLNTFPSGGCYTTSLPGYPDHVIVGMNTMFFSDRNTSTCMPVDTAAGHNELSWLTQTLAGCAKQNQKVWFTCHIPPGADAYKAVKAEDHGHTCGDHIKMMWKAEYNDPFIALVNRYKGVINGGIGGHTHMDEFRVIADPAGAPVSFFHINPSISPIDSNNPGFLMFTYDPVNMTMLDYTSYVFSGVENPSAAAWSEQYNFGTTYNVKGINAQTLSSVWQALATDTVLRGKYEQFFCGGGVHAYPAKWLPYWCCIGYAEQTAFTDCACETGK